MSRDEEWHRASAWLAGEHFSGTAGRLQLIGAPLRLGSITPGRTDLAPQAIRGILHKMSSFDVEHGLDLRRLVLDDAGDLPLAGLSPEDAFRPLCSRLQELSPACDALILLGGDNSITRPGVHGLGLPLKQVGLLTIDAHFDLRETNAGLTNGNPVRALLEDGLPGANLVQVGIQSFANSAGAVDVTRESGSHFVTASEVRRLGIDAVIPAMLEKLASRVERIYVDFDIDVLDRGVGPGSPGARPGGLHAADLQRAAYLCGAHPKVTIVDIVELDPERDVAEMTVQTAGSLVLWFASGVLSRLAKK